MSAQGNVVPKPVAQVDPVWARIREEAEAIVQAEPALAGFLFSSVINHTRFEDAIVHRLAQRLNHADMDAHLLTSAFEEMLETAPDLGAMFRSDVVAVFDRDPACHRFIDALLYFKGFHALQTHRFAHALYRAG
ncbi:MAG: serine O-acetyltransferase, partial [Pseudomonadota bacterium]